MSKNKKLYVICNSHMDPVWLWRLREGRSTWLNSCRIAVQMLEEFPFLRFTRSSSACYQWLEECDPVLFDRIGQLVSEGRWEVTGGWVEQSDVIITPPEVLLQQAVYGKEYFRSRFGVDVTTAYCVDSFGQNAGLPAVLAASGFKRYCWMRPMAHELEMPDRFRWKVPGLDKHLLSFRVQESYTTGTVENLDKETLRARLEELSSRPGPQSFFFGVGDHGGVLARKHLEWLLELGEEIPLQFVTLEEYFDQLEKYDNLPVLQGEFTHHAPGCYAACHEVKEQCACVEQSLYKAEKISLEQHDLSAARQLSDAWEVFLFNYFHDIYSGTCIRTSYEREVRDISGYAATIAGKVLDRGLQRLGAAMDTRHLTQGGVLLWNPLPQESQAICQFYAMPDPNEVGRRFDALVYPDGRQIPLQWVRGDCTVNGDHNNVLCMAPLAASEAVALAYGYRSSDAMPLPNVGVERQRKAFQRLHFAVLEDPFDTWGHTAGALGYSAEAVEAVGDDQVLQDGPLMSELSRQYCFRDSIFQLSIRAYANVPMLEMQVWGKWQECDCDLKLVLDTGMDEGSILSMQSGVIFSRRPDDCEQPFIGWVAANDGNRSTGFIAPDLHSYDSVGVEELRLTILRPVLYCEHAPCVPHGEEGYADLGQFRRRFWMLLEHSGDPRSFNALAQQRLMAPEATEITGNPRWKDSALAASGRPQWRVTPADGVVVLAQRLTADGKVLWDLQSLCDQQLRIFQGESCRGEFTLREGEIRTVELTDVACS